MIQVLGQDKQQLLPERLKERLEALGIAVALVSADGRAVPLSTWRPLEKIVFAAPPFEAALRGALPTMAQKVGEVREVWPGAWVVTLPSARRRRAGAERNQPQSLVALLLGEAFLESDQLRLVCDTSLRDFRTTVSAVERSSLVTAAEAHRLAGTLVWMQQDSLEIDRRSGEIQALGTQLGESYEELSLLYKLSTSMTINLPPKEFLRDACRDLRQVLGLRWMNIQFSNADGQLEELTRSNFTAFAPGFDTNADAIKHVGEELLRREPPIVSAQIIHDAASFGIAGLDRLTHELLVVPILREGKPLGLIYGGSKLSDAHLTTVDSKLCSSLASGVSIFLTNAMLYEDMSAMFMGTLHALTSSIDAKDSYTRGHSERVAMMSRKLAAAAGLDECTVQRVYLSGLVHDVGKIGVPESVLCKPGVLTPEEFAQVKLHPEIGARILRDIRQMQDLIPGVLYHHERWNGQGYPANLAGTDIPLFGRLICIADSFDAMSSNRTYRRSLSTSQVLEEITRCAGTQFDPDLARLFVQLDFSDFTRMIEEHQLAAKRQVSG